MSYYIAADGKELQVDTDFDQEALIVLSEQDQEFEFAMTIKETEALVGALMSALSDVRRNA